MRVVWTCTGYGNEERKGFVNLSVMVGIFFSGLSFGLGHLYIGFGFAVWVALAIAVLFSMKEE